jgi:hypothetical protein
MITTKIALGVLLLAASFSSPTFAAPEETEVSPDDYELCSFQADAGGYVCDVAPTAGSLTNLGDSPRRGRGRPTISHVPSSVRVIQQN